MLRRQISSALAPAANSSVERPRRDREVPAQVVQRARGGAVVVEDAVYDGQVDPEECQLRPEPLDAVQRVVGHDLGQDEVGVEAVVGDKTSLLHRIPMRVGPSSKGQSGLIAAEDAPEILSVRDAALRPD